MEGCEPKISAIVILTKKVLYKESEKIIRKNGLTQS